MPIFYSGKDYLALPREPQPWLVKRLIPVSGLVNMYGKPKTRKSYAAFGIAEAIANGKPDWNGMAVQKHGPVAYLQVDTPREEWACRVARFEHHGYNTDNIFFADMNTVPAYPFNILDPRQMEALKDELADRKPVLTIIDTLRESHNGDENDSSTMRNVVTALVAASRPSAVLLISHQRKDNVMATEKDTDLMDDARGSSYISGRMDMIIRLTQARLTHQGRAVKLTYHPLEEAPEQPDDEDGCDLSTPPPMIYFKDKRQDTELVKIEAALPQLLAGYTEVTYKGVADLLVGQKVTDYKVDHLRSNVLPKMLERLNAPVKEGGRMKPRLVAA